MKKFKYIMLPLLVVVLAITACNEDFLEVAPTGSLGNAELSSLAGVEGALIGSYSILLGRAGFFSDATNWFFGSVLGGEANKGTNEGDQSQVNEIQGYTAQTNNASVFAKYSNSFEGVARANGTLRLLRESTTISADDATRLEGEARFLRGHYYFDLKKNFDDVPYVDETWNEVDEVGNGQSLWPFIEADFKFGYDNLPGTQNAAGRANKWAAGAYYAKALLFQGKHSEALTVLNDVIANGQTANGQAYGLNANYADAFFAPNDNSMESVFASQAAAGTGSVNNANPGLVLNFPNGGGPGGCCGFNQPSTELANSFRTDANGLPLLDGSYNDAGNALVTDQGLFSDAAFTPDTGNLDPRLDHSIGRRGIPYLDWGPHPGRDWIRDQPYAGPYAPKKFIYYQNVEGNNDGSSWTPGYTTVNYNIIRYADVLLWAAECEIETGNMSAGRDLINIVRERAQTSMIMDNGSPVANYVVEPYSSFASQDEARTALRMERKLELSGEGHRFYDLVRWGIAANEINSYLAVENEVLLNSALNGASFTTNKNEFLPIPQNEIDLLGVGVLQQNPGY